MQSRKAVRPVTLCTYIGLIRPCSFALLVAVSLDSTGTRRILGYAELLDDVATSAERLLIRIDGDMPWKSRHLFVVSQLEGIKAAIGRTAGSGHAVQLCRMHIEAALLQQPAVVNKQELRSEVRRAWLLGEAAGMKRLLELAGSAAGSDQPADRVLEESLPYCFTVDRLNVAPTVLPELRTASVLQSIEASLRRRSRGGDKGEAEIDVSKLLRGKRIPKLRCSDALASLSESLKLVEQRREDAPRKVANGEEIVRTPGLSAAVSVSQGTARGVSGESRECNAMVSHSRPTQALVRYVRGPLVESAKQLVDRIPQSIARLRQISGYAARQEVFRSELQAREASKLVDRLFFVPGQKAPKNVVFMGVDSASAYSTICARTAQLLANRLSTDVCVVDASLGGPGLHREFGLSENDGLCAALGDPTHCTQHVRQLFDETNLWIMPRGDARRLNSTHLTWDRIRCLVSQLQKRFEYLLFHAPPAPGLLDGVLLGKLTDGVVLVIEAEKTRKHGLRSVTQDLAAAEVRVLAAVLNQRSYPIPQAVYERLFGVREPPPAKSLAH